MTIQQIIIFGTLILTLALFVSGKIRYDVVAIIALLIVVLFGLIPVDKAFIGFSNPAVITVAAVLVLSRGLQNSGIVDLIGQWLSKIKGGVTIQLFILTSIVAVLSAFMNNVGALALLLPVAIQLARKKQVSPSVFLMPIAFASLLGGMTTLIGTPPNIIASSFRQHAAGEPFQMFDFSPVGVGVSLAGILFISILGWRLIPKRKGRVSSSELFDIEKYVTEVRVTATSKLHGKPLREFHKYVEQDVNIIGLIREGEKRLAPSPQTIFRDNDVLILQIDTSNLENLVASTGIEMVGSGKLQKKDIESNEIGLIEAVITPNSLLVGGTARSLDLRKRYGVNLLAVARQGTRLRASLDQIRFRSGDVLMLQSPVDIQKDVLSVLGCLPLAQRNLKIGQTRRIALSLIIFITSLIVAAVGLLPVQIAFLIAVVLMIISKLVTLREAYESIDLSIVILLGAMIPVGEALETTGGAQLIANSILHFGKNLNPEWTLVIVLVVTMFLSDLVNNAAAVVLMAPIGIGVAQGLGVSIDPFLLAIAIGASCAFLTPIGHQSNTLVMGPGGYKFGDYWRMGLLLEIIVVLVAIPLVTFFWKF